MTNMNDEDTMRLQHASRFFRRESHDLDLKPENGPAKLVPHRVWWQAPRKPSLFRTVREFCQDAGRWLHREYIPENNPDIEDDAPLWMGYALVALISVGLTVAVICIAFT